MENPDQLQGRLERPLPVTGVLILKEGRRRPDWEGEPLSSSEKRARRDGCKLTRALYGDHAVLDHTYFWLIYQVIFISQQSSLSEV
jgi:hypothetical protein